MKTRRLERVRRGWLDLRRTVLAVAVAMPMFGWCTAIHAQGPFAWRPDTAPLGNVPPAAAGVLAATTWDPDGPGALDTLLVVGGLFTSGGGVPAANIAAWNGEHWTPFGSGMNGAVRALTVYNGELIAAGSFSMAGGAPANRIARWDGESWQPLGAGLSFVEVRALAVFQGDLYAAGVVGQPTGRLARWNGSSWQIVDGVHNGAIQALAVYNDGLIVAGLFNTQDPPPFTSVADSIARWDGSSWQALGTGMLFQRIDALAVFDGDLIAGGAFTNAGGVPANHVARWDGTSWHSLGSGVDGVVLSLTAYSGSGELIAGGEFTTASSTAVNHTARWDGTSWQPMNQGLNATVRALTTFASDVVAGGNDSQLHAIWARWGPLCPQGDVNGDGVVNVDDLIAVILAWGPCPQPPTPCPADVDGSGAVDVDDLIAVILNWGGR